MKLLALYNSLQRHKAHLQAGRGASGASRASRASRAARQAGMTLLEILIVLAIIGLVFGLFIGPQLAKLFSGSQEDVAGLAVQALANDAYTKWSLKNTGCPGSLEELGEYVTTSLQDPWGNNYMMHCGDNAPPSKRFGVSSSGPDGKVGTEDDIQSWNPRKGKQE